MDTPSMSIFAPLKLTTTDNDKLFNWLVCSAILKTMHYARGGYVEQEHYPFLQTFLNGGETYTRNNT